MSEKLYGIPEGEGKRIANAVRRVEGAPQRRAGGPLGAPNIAQNVFLAQIIAEDDDNPGRYSWKKKDAIGGVLSDSDPAITSTGYSAFEINGRTGIQPGTRIYLEFNGYDTSGADAYIFDAMMGLLVGEITSKENCNGFVMASVGDVTWTVYLAWPAHDVYQKYMEVGEDILFFPLPNYDPEFPAGIAIGVEKDYVSLRVDGGLEIRKISDLNVISKIGPADREDWDTEDLVQPNENCSEETQAGLRWRGNTVLSYPNPLEEIRNFSFDGADENPGTVVPEDLLCVRFTTDKPSGNDADSTGITAKITATVPILKVAVDQEGKWLSIGGGGCGGETAGGNPTISHIGPDGDSEEEIPVPMTLSLTGCTIKLQPPTVKVDATGHFIGFGTGSPGNSTEIEIPNRTVTVVTGISQSGCTVSGTTEEIKVLDC